MLKSMLVQDAPASREQLQQQIQRSVLDAQKTAQAAAQQAAEAARAARQNGTLTMPDVRGPGMPGVEVRQYGMNDIPPQVETISITFFVMIAVIVIGTPLMRAIARRIDRGTQAIASVPREVTQHLQQLSQSVDAIAIEVERISEGQRFTTKMLSERAREEKA
jgi:hypothetical protein